ncbi:MAG: glycosidase [Actinobacteria bacterium]|nr:MAG: glycosidase [Actinomycetota bacterium]
MTPSAIVTATEVELAPDHTRVITRFFVPGHEDVGPGDSRAAPVIERILRLGEEDVEAALRDVDERFSDRHEALHQTFSEHAAMVTSRIDPDVSLSKARELLLGASFTHEYAIEGAALCNPSAVLHPHQDASSDAAFILSVRGIGEGHRSSIGFRTGTVTAAGAVTIDKPGPFPRTGAATQGLHHRDVFHGMLADLGDDRENAAYVLDGLPPRFDDAHLAARITSLAADKATRRNTATTIANLRNIARSSYRVDFTVAGELSERVLWPQAPIESHGMEDARFVRFLDERGDVTYYATYTAFDGINVSQQLLQTADFTTFNVSPISGAAAMGKGLALFPRQVDGRYVALSRSDRETNAIAFSDDLRRWDTADTIQIPERPWEILQLGNCGSPIETDAGWLVLSHGVGPMRTYSLGVILLDLDQPQRVLARSVEPIITPDKARRGGYVPNVVYSCGGFAHNDILVLPYGIGDQNISIATLSIEQLLSTLRPEPS